MARACNFSSKPTPKIVPNVEYRLMREGDIDEVFGVVSDAFSRFNPLIKAIQMPPSIFMQIFNGMRKQYLEQNLSYIAVDQNSSSGKPVIAGCMLCDDYYSDLFNKVQESFLSSSEDKIDERWLVIFKEIDKLKKEIFQVTKPQQGIMCHLALAGIRNDYQKMGITTKIAELQEALAIKRGFKYLVAECASEWIFRILQKDGFESIYEIPFKDIKIKGCENLSGSLRAMVKKIS